MLKQCNQKIIQDNFICSISKNNRFEKGGCFKLCELKINFLYYLIMKTSRQAIFVVRLFVC